MPTPLGAAVPAQILALLADGTPRSRVQLAQVLSVSPGRVGAALAALSQRGQVAIIGYEHLGESRRWGQAQAALWMRMVPPEA